MPTTTVFLFAACLSLGAAEPTDPVKQGLDYLVSAQDKDGAFAPEIPSIPLTPFLETGACPRRAITAFCVLALLAKGEKKYDVAARKGLQFLAQSEKPPLRVSYEHSYAALALVEGALRWPKDFRPAAKKAVEYIVDNIPTCGTTCRMAIVLHVLWSARQAGLPAPDAVIQRGRALIYKHFDDEEKMFTHHEGPPTTFCATSMALAALQQWGEKDSKMVTESVDKIARDLKDPDASKSYFEKLPGYAGGDHLLLAHGVAFRHAQNAKLLQDWLLKVRKKLAQEIRKDGSWEGPDRYLNDAYATALACLILQLDRTPKIAWLQRRQQSK